VDTDERLVARCRDEGDERAFAELVSRYRDRVFRLAVSILGQGFAGEAEEVAQEVFLRVHRGLASFRGDAQFSSWLYRIAFNQAVNLKARVRYRAPHVGDEALQEMPAPGASPLDRLHAARRNSVLWSCMEELPEVYQSALRLHYWMGESVAEIADLIGVPENTVKSYLHRARRLLHVMLQERGLANVF
jgi:RNA polymerase sigma-70 factor (ECF subfamily)